MVVELNSLVPLVTIIGAAMAPTIAAIWARKGQEKEAKEAAALAATSATKVAEVKSTLVTTAAATDGKLDQIHVLVNNQLSQAVERFDAATQEIAELKLIVQKLQEGG